MNNKHEEKLNEKNNIAQIFILKYDVDNTIQT